MPGISRAGGADRSISPAPLDPGNSSSQLQYMAGKAAKETSVHRTGSILIVHQDPTICVHAWPARRRADRTGA
jgi:hypothetical protein